MNLEELREKHKGQYIRIGDCSTPHHSLVSGGDLEIAGELETEGKWFIAKPTIVREVKSEGSYRETHGGPSIL